jgi:hypothetical protein
LNAGADLHIDADTEGGSVITMAGGTLSRSTKASNISNNSAISGTTVKDALDGISTSFVKRTSVTKSYSDFSAAGLTKDIEILSLPAGAKIVDVYARVTTVFSGGAIATYTISVGTTGIEYMIANDVLSAPVALIAAGTKGANLTTVGKSNVESFAGVTSIRAYATSTVDTLNNATQGSITFYIEYIGG